MKTNSILCSFKNVIQKSNSISQPRGFQTSNCLFFLDLGFSIYFLKTTKNCFPVKIIYTIVK